MSMFAPDRPPAITSDDLPEVTRLFRIFDRIAFNPAGELVAQLNATLPVLGPVLISLYVKENHLAVYRGGADFDAMIWSGYLRDLDIKSLDTTDREEMVRRVLVAVRDALTKAIHSPGE